MSEIAKKIRIDLKTAGYTKDKKCSVRRKYAGTCEIISIVVPEGIDTKSAVAIAKKNETIFWDRMLDEISCGGNTFVEVTQRGSDILL